MGISLGVQSLDLGKASYAHPKVLAWLLCAFVTHTILSICLPPVFSLVYVSPWCVYTLTMSLRGFIVSKQSMVLYESIHVSSHFLVYGLMVSWDPWFGPMVSLSYPWFWKGKVVWESWESLFIHWVINCTCLLAMNVLKCCWNEVWIFLLSTCKCYVLLCWILCVIFMHVYLFACGMCIQRVTRIV